MADGGESFIETVSVKFKVMEESLQGLKEALRKANQTVLEAQGEVGKSLEEKERSTQEELTRIRESHLDKTTQMRLREQRSIYELHEKQKAWLMERNDLDLKVKNDMMAAEQNAMDHAKKNIEEMKKGYGDLSNSINEVSKAIGINVGELAKAGTMVTAIFSAWGEGTKIERDELVFQTMRGTALSAGEKGLYEEWYNSATKKGIGMEGVGGNVSPAVATRVGASLMSSSAGLVNPADVFKKGGLADIALYTAPGAGISTDKALEHFKDMISSLRMSTGEVSTEFMKLVHTSRQLNDMNGKSIEATIGLAKNFSAYNLDIDTASRAVRSFWREIKDGKMSVEELVKVFQVGGKMSEGQAAYAGMEILGKDPAFASLLGDESGFGMARQVKRIMFANPLLGENLPMGTSEERKKTKEMLNERRNHAIRLYAEKAASLAQEGGGTPSEISAKTSKFLQAIVPINWSNLSPDMEDTLIKDMRSGTLSKRGEEAYKLGSMDPTVAELTKLGMDIRRLDTSPLQDILNTVKELLTVVGSGFMVVASYLVGDTKGASRYAAMVRSHLPGYEKLNNGDDSGLSLSPDALMARGRQEATQYLQTAKFDSPEQFSRAVMGAIGGKSSSVQKGWADILGSGALKTTLDGKLVFDFGHFGEYDVVVEKNRLVRADRMPKSGLVPSSGSSTAYPAPTNTPTPSPTLAVQ